MAKVTITIEDFPNGKVKVVSDPTFETMANMELSGHALSSAHGYAVFALNKIREQSKNMSSKIPILLPRVGR